MSRLLTEVALPALAGIAATTGLIFLLYAISGRSREFWIDLKRILRL